MCKNNVQFVFTHICFVGGSWLYMSFVFTYIGVEHNFHIRWCSCRLTATCQVSLVNKELLTLQGHLSSQPVVRGVQVDQSLLFCVVLSRSLFVLWPFCCLSFCPFFWPLCCLSFCPFFWPLCCLSFRLFFWPLCCLSFCPFFWSLCCLSFFDIQPLIPLWYLQTFL